MKNPITAIRGRVITVLAAIVLILLIQGPLRDVIQSRRRRVRLLCKTDHRALLEGGRQLLAEVAKGNLKSGIYYFRGRTELPNGVPVPQAIDNLRARTVEISEDGRMMMEMHGAMDHFGVVIYSESFAEPFEGFRYGDLELVGGLWYYDDEFQMNREYGKVVERMLQTGRREEAGE